MPSLIQILPFFLNLAIFVSNDGPDIYKPISLKCPSENNSVLEVIRKNHFGKLTKIEAVYNNSTPQHLKFYSGSAETGLKFNFEHDADVILSGKNPDLKIVIEQTNKLYYIVCEATDPDIRQRYNGIMRRNEESMRSIR